MTQTPTKAAASTADLCLPATTGAPGQARQALAALTQDPRIRDDGRLLVTEVVANAIEHTDTTQVHVLLRHEPDEQRLLCAVRDTNPTLPGTNEPGREPDLDTEGGRGLHLIDALAEAWGYLPDDHGKWLWFSLTIQPTAA